MERGKGGDFIIFLASECIGKEMFMVVFLKEMTGEDLEKGGDRAGLCLRRSSVRADPGRRILFIGLYERRIQPKTKLRLRTEYFLEREVIP